MDLSDEGLILERPHLGGVQRVYRFGDYGLSLVNGRILHSYPFRWEAAVIKFTGDDWELTYETPMTDDVEVFASDEEANDFIRHTKEWAITQPAKERPDAR